MVEVIKPEDFTPETSPFYVRLKFNIREKIEMALAFFLILPIRILIGVLSLVMAWGYASIGLMGFDESRPARGWRKTLQKLTCWHGQLCVRATGISVEVVGKQLSKDVAPVLIVAPHTSFLDGLAIFWSGLPFIVSREENKNIPFIGKCIEFAQAIFVRREERDSRQKTLSEITRRVNSDEAWKQFLLFPEGTTSNGKALMSFKAGGFLPGKPVQPVVIKYKNKHDTTSWTWDQPHGALICMFYTVLQWTSKAELHYLDVYVPSEEEKKDPLLYANNVRKVMAKALGVPLCDMSFEDIKKMYVKTKQD